MSGKIGGNIVRPYVAETWSAVYDCCCPKLSLRSVTDASIVHLSIDSVIEILPREGRGRTKRFGGIVEKKERMLPGEDYLSR